MTERPTFNGAELYPPSAGTAFDGSKGTRYYLLHPKAVKELMGRLRPGAFYRHLAGQRYYAKRLRPKAKRGSRKFGRR